MNSALPINHLSKYNLYFNKSKINLLKKLFLFPVY